MDTCLMTNCTASNFVDDILSPIHAWFLTFYRGFQILEKRTTLLTK